MKKMENRTIDVKVNVEDYFSKMKTEDSVTIITMCLNKLASKVEELKDLYIDLAKTYSVEMGLCDVTLLVQVSSSLLPDATQGVFGTSQGIEHAFTILMERGEAIKKEDNNG